MEEKKDQLGEDTDTVNTVRQPMSCCAQFMRLKYKCVLILSLTFLSSIALFSSIMTEVLQDDKSVTLMTHMVTLFTQIYFPNRTVHEVIEQIEN